MQTTKIDCDGYRVNIHVGDILRGGWSGVKVYSDPSVYISYGSGNMIDDHIKVMHVEFYGFNWDVVITDKQVIEDIKKEDDKSRWSYLVLSHIMRLLLPEQIFGLIQHTVNIVAASARKAGVDDKRKEIWAALGIDPSLHAHRHGT